MTNVAMMRVDYDSLPFDLEDLAADWWTQFDRWLADAIHENLTEPNAMVLATAGLDGAPSSRNVLAKQVDSSGVTFYTNFTSSKSSDLTVNPRVAATFSWLPLHRQVNIRGRVEKVDPATTLAYWRTRPRGAQLGAWASPQSIVVSDRWTLDRYELATEQRFGGGADAVGAPDIPVPPHWGGWRIMPRTVEFWQGRNARLHDRLRFRLDGTQWVTERLAP